MQQNTLKQLSEVLGLSISTVSRALKDHPDISEKTKTRVRELANALDYEPNHFAVQLRTQQSNMLGILVPSINNYFYDFFIAAVKEEGFSRVCLSDEHAASIAAEDIAVISISNGLSPTLYQPKITYVETSGYKLGKLAFQKMFSRLKANLEKETVFLESILVEGGSL